MLLVHYTWYTFLWNNQRFRHLFKRKNSIGSFAMHFPNLAEASFAYNVVIWEAVRTVLNYLVAGFLLLLHIDINLLSLIFERISWWKGFLFLRLIINFWSWTFFQYRQDSLMITFNKRWSLLHIVVHSMRFLWLSIADFRFVYGRHINRISIERLFSYFII